MTIYKNYTGQATVIDGEKIEPYNGRKTMKPQPGVVYIVTPKIYVKTYGRDDVVMAKEKKWNSV